MEEATDKSKKVKHKRSPIPIASSSYESDPCFSGEGSSTDKKIKRPFKKRGKRNPKDEGEKDKEGKGLGVSNWNIHVLDKIGVHYQPEAVSLSKMMETIQSRIGTVLSHSVRESFPSFISSLEEYTKQALNFSLLENIHNYFDVKPAYDNLITQTEAVENFIWKIREESEKLESDGARKEYDMFERWSGRVHDFMTYYKRFLSDQYNLPKTESRFVQLFMAFSRIFFLDPELGGNEKKFIRIGKEIHSCIPDLRFLVTGDFSLNPASVMVMHTEVKQCGIKRSSLPDDEEKFDIREKLSDKVRAQHGGELLAERESSVFTGGVLGTICIGTEIIFTFMDLSSDHLNCIKEEGETVEYSSMISYTKAYNFLSEKDRNELLPVMFFLGYLQSGYLRKIH